MRKLVALGVALAALALVFGCNKQKPVKLDYSEKLQDGTYTPTGMPGDGTIGTPEHESKYTGYQHGKPGDPATGTPPPDQKPPEQKPPEQQPPEQPKDTPPKPEEPKPSDPKPAEDKPAEAKPAQP